jgi:hypothetical protein
VGVLVEPELITLSQFDPEFKGYSCCSVLLYCVVFGGPLSVFYHCIVCPSITTSFYTEGNFKIFVECYFEVFKDFYFAIKINEISSE